MSTPVSSWNGDAACHPGGGVSGALARCSGRGHRRRGVPHLPRPARFRPLGGEEVCLLVHRRGGPRKRLPRRRGVPRLPPGRRLDSPRSQTRGGAVRPDLPYRRGRCRLLARAGAQGDRLRRARAQGPGGDRLPGLPRRRGPGRGGGRRGGAVRRLSPGSAGGCREAPGTSMAGSTGPGAAAPHARTAMARTGSGRWTIANRASTPPG